MTAQIIDFAAYKAARQEATKQRQADHGTDCMCLPDIIPSDEFEAELAKLLGLEHRGEEITWFTPEGTK